VHVPISPQGNMGLIMSCGLQSSDRKCASLGTGNEAGNEAVKLMAEL